MANDPFRPIQEAMEAARQAAQQATDDARREGYAAGYADALKRLTDFMSHEGGGPAGGPSGGRYRGQSGQFASSTSSGVTRELVYEALRMFAPGAVGIAELIRSIHREHGIRLASTSVRRALRRLAREGVADQRPGTKSWSFIRSVHASNQRKTPGGDTPGVPRPNGALPLGM